MDMNNIKDGLVFGENHTKLTKKCRRKGKGEESVQEEKNSKY